MLWFWKIKTVAYLIYSGHSFPFVSFVPCFYFGKKMMFSQNNAITRGDKGLKYSGVVWEIQKTVRILSIYSPLVLYFCLLCVSSTVKPEIVCRFECVKGPHKQSGASTLEPRVLEAKTWNLKKRNFRHKCYLSVTNTSFSQLCK